LVTQLSCKPLAAGSGSERQKEQPPVMVVNGVATSESTVKTMEDKLGARWAHVEGGKSGTDKSHTGYPKSFKASVFLGEEARR
jgi:hypothetical protein